MMIEPTIRTCYHCGSKKRRWVTQFSDRYGRIMIKWGKLQCRTCGRTRLVKLGSRTFRRVAWS